MNLSPSESLLAHIHALCWASNGNVTFRAPWVLGSTLVWTHPREDLELRCGALGVEYLDVDDWFPISINEAWVLYVSWDLSVSTSELK